MECGKIRSAAQQISPLHLWDMNRQENWERRILRQGLKIDKILYSPLIRAKETARQISEAAGIPMEEGNPAERAEFRHV